MWAVGDGPPSTYSANYPGIVKMELSDYILGPNVTYQVRETQKGQLKKAKVYQQDGYQLAQSLCPPTPRRGLLLIDPSYEIKDDYAAIPQHIAKVTRAWNVGIIALWYPILTNGAHAPMLNALTAAHPDALRNEVNFPPARPGHGMIGSGMFVINPPYGLSDESKAVAGHYAKLRNR